MPFHLRHLKVAHVQLESNLHELLTFTQNNPPLFTQFDVLMKYAIHPTVICSGKYTQIINGLIDNITFPSSVAKVADSFSKQQ